MLVVVVGAPGDEAGGVVVVQCKWPRAKRPHPPPPCHAQPTRGRTPCGYVYCEKIHFSTIISLLLSGGCPSMCVRIIKVGIKRDIKAPDLCVRVCVL